MKHNVLLQLTNTVFTGSPATATGGQEGEQEQEDALENWLIGKIVESLEKITTWNDTSKLFWQVMHGGKGRDLSVKVFQRRADLDRKYPDLIKIEDDWGVITKEGEGEGEGEDLEILRTVFDH
jgi:hypothetical protein